LRNQLADLVSTLITEAAEDSGPGGAHASGPDLAREVRDWVNERLGDPALQPSVIAAGNYISVRHLHKLFKKQDSTVSSWIQQRRLDECRRELGRNDGRTVKVSTVAQRWGFINAAHFSRAFRARYAVSPRDWREMRASIGPGRGDVVPTRSGD
jgi:AraC-like DNA-binding protein